MSKLIRNVGKYTGLNGVAIVYLCEDDAGRKFLANRAANSSDPAVLGDFKFMPRSTIESGIIGGSGAFIAKSVAYADLLETPSTGLLDSSNNVTISNARQGGGTFPRIWDTNTLLYGIKGEGYDAVPSDTSIVASAADVTAWKNVTAREGDANGTGSGTGNTILSSAKGLFDQAVDFVNKNPLLGALIIFGALYFILKAFGIDLLVELGLKKKSKKKGR